jgi:DNA-binding HxlR family transcriptional regulator
MSASSHPRPPEEVATPASCRKHSTKALTAVALVQEKWTLRIVDALRGGPLGFNQMKRDGGGVNSTTLAQRLVLLEQVGLLRKTVQSTMPPRTSYELTEAGHALAPIIDAITAWGERYLPDAIPTCANSDGACLADLSGEGPMDPAACAP